MKPLSLLLLMLSCWCASAAVQIPQTVYFQDFETVGKPANWSEWNTLQFHADSWNIPSAQALAGTNSIKFAWDNPALALGAFYQLPFPMDDIKFHCLFKVDAYPTVFAIEILDMYSAPPAGDEICDIYLNTDGRLFLFAGGASTGLTAASIPTNTLVNIWVHYINNVGSPSVGTAAWNTNSVEPLSGDKFISRADGLFHVPVVKLLVGPVTATGVNFWYDNIEVSIPLPTELPVRDITVSGLVQIQGTNSFR